MLHSKNAVAVPPGETIREQLENRGMSPKEFASRMGMSEKHISELLNGKVELTYNVSLRLESILGVPAQFWNNLEALYREKLARVNAELKFTKPPRPDAGKARADTKEKVHLQYGQKWKKYYIFLKKLIEERKIIDEQRCRKI